jgi:hypothetical protein
MYLLNTARLAKPGFCHSDYALNFMNIVFARKGKRKKERKKKKKKTNNPVFVVIAHQYQRPIISIKLINLFLKSIQNRSLKWV